MWLTEGSATRKSNSSRNRRAQARAARRGIRPGCEMLEDRLEMSRLTVIGPGASGAIAGDPFDVIADAKSEQAGKKTGGGS
jgi:hypothetical protein